MGATSGSGGADASGTFNVGISTVTFTATDDESNTAQCANIVTVNDTENPTANCPSNITQNNDAGQCGAIVNFVIPSPTDNCAGATSSASPASGSIFSVGTTQVTVTATDGADNTGQCTFDVVVNDTEAPTAICQSVTVALDGSGNYSLAASEINNGSSSNCGISSLSVSPNSFDCANIGNNTVTLTVTASNSNMASCTTNVEVQDNMAPTGVTCQDVTVSLDASGVFNLSVLFVTSGLSSVNLWVEWERILRLIKADVPAHSSAT
jgi:hypothetical protein